MNGDRPVEDAHYTETGFPYAATGSYIDFYGGASQGPLTYAHSGTMHPQVLAFVFLNKFYVPSVVKCLQLCMLL